VFTQKEVDRLVVAVLAMLPPAKTAGERRERVRLMESISRARDGKPTYPNHG
jgi:hypothetical protein